MYCWKDWVKELLKVKNLAQGPNSDLNKHGIRTGEGRRPKLQSYIAAILPLLAYAWLKKEKR